MRVAKEGGREVVARLKEKREGKGGKEGGWGYWGRLEREGRRRTEGGWIGILGEAFWRRLSDERFGLAGFIHLV